MALPASAVHTTPLGIDVDAARIEARRGHLVDMAQATSEAGSLPRSSARESRGRLFGDAPDRVVHGARDHPIEAIADLRVELRVGRRVRDPPCARPPPLQPVVAGIEGRFDVPVIDSTAA